MSIATGHGCGFEFGEPDVSALMHHFPRTDCRGHLYPVMDAGLHHQFVTGAKESGQTICVHEVVVGT